jgi:MSHA biogenesis protein MshI
MPRRFFRLPGKAQALGVETTREGAALVRSAPGKNGPRILEAECCSWREEEEQSRTLSRSTREMAAHRVPVVSVLPLQAYQLLQIQAPNVKDSEMRMAVGWQIKDLIDYPLQNTVIDYFPAPDSPGLGKMVYVVAAERGAVQEQADLFQNARLRIQSIDIAELALRNVVLQENNSDAGLALLHMEEESGLILIFKNGTLYVARRLRSGLHHLLQSGPEPENGGILESEDRQGTAFESVLLDLQRTLDYFESNFRAPPVGNLLLAPQLGDIPELHSHLQNNLDLSVRLLDIQRLLGEDLSHAEQGRCLLALGCALKTREG